MVTIGPKTADPGSMLSDLAVEIEGLADWTDADPYVTNDQSDDAWYNNGRVFDWAATGTSVLFYLVAQENNGIHNNGDLRDARSADRGMGLRIVHCDSWDATNHIPNEPHNANNIDPFSGQISNRYNHYDDHRANANSGGRSGASVYTTRYETGAVDYANNYSVTYDFSVRNDGVSLFAADQSDSNAGSAGYCVIEHLTNKLWTDGVTPVAVISRSCRSGTNRGIMELSYGFRSFKNDNGRRIGAIGRTTEAIEGADWGFINPRSNDDTFFFKRPVAYPTNRNAGKNGLPGAVVEDAIPNYPTGGGVDGDTLTFGGNTYKVKKQGGASSSGSITLAMRYE